MDLGARRYPASLGLHAWTEGLRFEQVMLSANLAAGLRALAGFVRPSPGRSVEKQVAGMRAGAQLARSALVGRLLDAARPANRADRVRALELLEAVVDAANKARTRDGHHWRTPLADTGGGHPACCGRVVLPLMAAGGAEVDLGVLTAGAPCRPMISAPAGAER